MEKVYQIALTLVDGVGSVLFRQLINHFGSAEAVFNAPKERLIKLSGIGKMIVENITNNKNILEKAEKIVKDSDIKNIQIILSSDEAYPKRLKALYDAPAILYYSGNANLNHTKTIGIVGTRQATEYGKKITTEIVEGLKSYNPSIISGLAYGIDIIAHKAAIEQNLPTVAVVANGLDITYPASHKKYTEAIKNNGAIISENSIGMQPIASLFLARNRIIAGLSDLVIVVESASKGGALVTAEFANNYHRDVFAVPGMLGNKYSEGTNKLISSNKAQIFTKVEDLVNALNWDIAQNANSEIINNDIDLTTFTDEEAQVITLLRLNKEMLIDDLSWQSNISLNRLASLLLNLEFQDIVKALPGKKFALKV